MEVLNAIAFDDENGNTNTASGLRAAESQVLVADNGDRAGMCTRCLNLYLFIFCEINEFAMDIGSAYKPSNIQVPVC